MKLLKILLFTFISNLVFAQKDSIRLLPSAEIVAQRLNYFTVGQNHLTTDSFALALFQNQSLAAYLSSQTPLSIKAYGTGTVSVATRGVAASHTAMVWNGINLQNPLNGGADIALLNVGAIEQIDVKLGGCSALFGSGAIGGVVQLDNKKPQKDGLHGQLGYGLGSVGWGNEQLRLDYKNAKIGASLNIGHQAATNDFRFKNTAEIGQPLQKAAHAAYDFLNVSGNFYAQISPNDFFKIHFWRSQNYREITPTMTASNNNALYRDTANRMTAEWAHFFKKSYLKLRGAYLFDKNFYASDVIKNSQNGIRSYIGEAEWNYNFSKNNVLRIGANNTTDVSDNNNYKQNPQRNRMALFVNQAFSSDFITVSGNIRQEWVNNGATPTTFSVGFEKPFSVKKTPDLPLKKEWILRGAVSRNFNIPTFNDLYWANLGNPNLVNERGWSKELGLKYKRKTARSEWGFYTTVFDIDITNRIAWLPQSDGQWRPNNIAQVQSMGVEAGINYQRKVENWHFITHLNYQYADAKDGNGGVQLYVPKHNASASARLFYKTFYASWQQSASSKRYGTTDKIIATEPFTLADAALGFTPSVWRTKGGDFNLKMDIRLRIDNVLNADYQVITFYPNPRRQFRLEVLALF
ncbi:MAG: TonB-dependent receptor plug domain-containing protein [Saprospiraceae bacterium]|nr:TonB-dependent receptor plug domain-containing protein [Saprospiraceae bacterium]